MSNPPTSPPLSENQKALIVASSTGDVAAVRTLLDQKISPNFTDSETNTLGLELAITPLICAAAHGHTEIIRDLLTAGADIRAATFAYKDDGGPGSQSLHHALARHHLPAATLLLDSGADLTAIGRYGRSPLTAGLTTMHLDAVEFLLQRGADVMLKPKRKDYEPPLFVAASNINNTTSMVLRDGKFVLEVAPMWERKDELLAIFRTLLAAGADPNAPGPRNTSPLHRLAMGKPMPDDLRLPLIHMLLNAGARPDQTNKDGSTPLRIAELYKLPTVVELLKPS